MKKDKQSKAYGFDISNSDVQMDDCLAEGNKDTGYKIKNSKMKIKNSIAKNNGDQTNKLWYWVRNVSWIAALIAALKKTFLS